MVLEEESFAYPNKINGFSKKNQQKKSIHNRRSEEKLKKEVNSGYHSIKPYEKTFMKHDSPIYIEPSVQGWRDGSMVLSFITGKYTTTFSYSQLM